MPACALRYRLDGSGPAVYLVECGDQYHLYTRGALGVALPEGRIQEMVAHRRGGRWVPVADDLATGVAGRPRHPVQAANEAGEFTARPATVSHQESRLNLDFHVDQPVLGELEAPPA